MLENVVFTFKLYKTFLKREKATTSLSILSVLLLLLLNNNNAAECMEIGNKASAIANELVTNNQTNAETLLEIIRTQNFSSAQMQELDTLINTTLAENPENIYVVYNGNTNIMLVTLSLYNDYCGI